MKCFINGANFIKLLFLLTELFKFEIKKCGQILCAHKPYFLMPGHIYSQQNTVDFTLVVQLCKLVSYHVCEFNQ